VAAFVCVLFLTPVVIGLIGSLRRDQYTPVIAVGVGLVIAALSILLARRKANRLFKDPTPDPAIAYYHSSTGSLPNGKAMGAYLSAYAALRYTENSTEHEPNWPR
jgi:hypothetical protein